MVIIDVDEEADNGMDKEEDMDMGYKKLSCHRKSGHKSFLAIKNVSNHKKLSGHKKLSSHKQLPGHKS